MERISFSLISPDDYDDLYALWSRTEGMGLSSADSRENIIRYLERNPGCSFAAFSVTAAPPSAAAATVPDSATAAAAAASDSAAGPCAGDSGGGSGSPSRPETRPCIVSGAPNGGRPRGGMDERPLNSSPDFSRLAGLTLIGSILAGHDGRRGYIHHLAVDRAYRGRGIGRELVGRALSALRREGIEKCHLFIFTDNTSGIVFWEHNGWKLRTDIEIMSREI